MSVGQVALYGCSVGWVASTVVMLALGVANGGTCVVGLFVVSAWAIREVAK